MKDIADFRLPDGFYTLVRLVVSAESAFIAWSLYQRMNKFQIGSALFGLIAMTFNPIMPVRFPRAYWAVIDLAVAASFLGCAILVRRAAKQPDA